MQKVPNLINESKNKNKESNLEKGIKFKNKKNFKVPNINSKNFNKLV